MATALAERGACTDDGLRFVSIDGADATAASKEMVAGMYGNFDIILDHWEDGSTARHPLSLTLAHLLTHSLTHFPTHSDSLTHPLDRSLAHSPLLSTLSLPLSPHLTSPHPPPHLAHRPPTSLC